MTTTTIRLPDDLKVRVARAAERTGTTAHNFILTAVTEKTVREERRMDFHDVAEARYTKIATTGMAIPWNEMRKYIQARAAGKSRKRPAPRKLGR